MLTRRALFGPLAVSVAGFATSAWPSNERPVANAESLAKRAVRRGRLYGCAVTSAELSDAAFVPVLRREANILVAEYEMKRHVMEPHPQSYNFTPADALLRFARESKMAFRGHTLVWHKANPPWLEDALSGPGRDAYLSGFIQTAAGRYRGQMHSWDVVNEALLPEGGRKDNLRETLWLKAFGPSYIDLAFHAARAADPHALLVYNDWGCEAGAARNDQFRAATLDFIEGAKARGIPIDAYGMQGHLQAYGTQVDQRKLHAFLGHLKALGLKILVTEHDVDDSGGPSDIAARDRAVADTSRRFLDVVLDNAATIAVLTWGLSDRFVDPPGIAAALAGYRPRILPLDSSFARKPMWSSIATSLSAPRLRLSQN